MELNNEKPKHTGGRFVKGVSGNPKGKPLGTKSAKTIIREMQKRPLREVLQFWFQTNLPYLLEEILKMKPSKSKVDAVCTLLNFALPKLSNVDSNISVDKMTDEQVNSHLAKIFSQDEIKSA